jgi:hypothetical protein
MLGSKQEPPECRTSQSPKSMGDYVSSLVRRMCLVPSGSIPAAIRKGSPGIDVGGPMISLPPEGSPSLYYYYHYYTVKKNEMLLP